MKSRLFALSSATVFVCVLTARLYAAEGILLVQRTTTGNDVRTSQVQVEKTRMRTEIVDASGATQVIVFDATKQVLDMIDMNRKTYTEMTKADVDAMAGQMQSMMAMMGNMPEAQRAQVEAMMRGRGMPGMSAPVKTEYRRNGTDRVGRWTCDKYDGYQNAQKTSEICTVTPQTLGITAADLEATGQLAQFLSTALPQIAEQIAMFGRPEAQGFSGVPVKHVYTTAGSQTTMEISEVSRQQFQDSLFAIPQGFVKQDMMAGMGRGRGR